MGKKNIKTRKSNETQLYLPLTTELAWSNELKKDIQRNRRTKKTDCGKIKDIKYNQSYNTEVQELGHRIEQFINNP